MHIAPYDPRHCRPHAIVTEDDTQLVLGADPEPRPVHEPLETLEREALSAPEHPVGAVVIRPGRPARILAIVHDLDREPTWHERSVREAFGAALEASRLRGLTWLAMPLLGTRHGRLPRARALALLADALDAAPAARPERLWLVDETAATCRALERRLAGDDPG